MKPKPHTKPFRRWCVVHQSPGSLPWVHHAGAHGESLAAYLRRMCTYYGGTLASVNMTVCEIEVRVVEPKRKRKARKP